MKRSGPVAWQTAATVARRVASSEPFSVSYLGASMQSQFDELTGQAEQLVQAETGLVSARGFARNRVVDRPEWAEVNLGSIERLLRPALERFDARAQGGFIKRGGRHLTGVEIGAVLGWMSSRVLGQYDQLLSKDDNAENQDMIYYVAPNVLSLEKRYGFPPGQFRLWLALHECTHRAQFTAVPWLTDFFKSQVEVLLSATDIDPQRLATSVRKAVQRGESSQETDKQLGGLMAAVAGPEQQAALDKMMGLMALLEGHAEVIMTRAGAGLVPDADRFHRVLHERRNAARGIARVMQRLLGMDAKLRQYAQGAAFVKTVEEVGGSELFNRVWSEPSALPTYGEIARPRLWVDRISSVSATEVT